MMTFIMVIHALVCILLACIILMQSGRGGGLTESFASAESIFGAQTNTLLVKTTTILGSLFLVTCLSLALMHSREGKSLMSERVAIPAKSQAALPLGSTAAQAVNTMDKSAAQDVSDVQEVGQNAAQRAATQTQQLEEKLNQNTTETPTPAPAPAQ